MMDDNSGSGGHSSNEDDLIEIDLNFESMRRFQAEFSPNLSKDGLFIDTGEPLSPGSVVRFRVILPEDFIFLEGTAVVEWMRDADAASDGAPGMALRFVTLSPQNQELVEQLVQDHVDAGGTAFDFDVRPTPGDFPTDALEGAPPPVRESSDEGYRLTVRRTGPNLQAEALQALSEATIDVQDDDAPPSPEEVRGFAILSKTSVPLVEEALEQDPDIGEGEELESAPGPEDPEVDEVEVVGESPALDGSTEPDSRVESDEAPVDVALDFGDAVEEEKPDSNAEENLIEDGPGGTTEGEASESSDDSRITDKYPVEGAWEKTSDPIDDGKIADEYSVEAVGEETPDPTGDDRITDKYPMEAATEWTPEPSDDSEIADEVPTDAAESSESDLTEDPESTFCEPGETGEEAVDGTMDPVDEVAESVEEPEPVLPPEPEHLPTPAEFDSGPEIIEEVASAGLGGPAFDVSLPEPDDEPDTTPVLPDEGRDEVTVHTDEDEVEEPQSTRRLWPFALAAVFVLAIAGGFLWPRLSARNEGGDPIPPQEPVIAAADLADDVASTVPDEQPRTDSGESAEPTVDVSEAVAEDPTGEVASAAEDASAVEIEPEPEPEPESPAPEIDLARADALTSIDVEPGPNGTVIRIRGNGSLEDGVISMERLTSPPRVLVRVRGIRETFRPYTIETSTPEVSRVRSGLHEERRPPEMWVVVDLTGSDVTMGGIDIRRDTAEFVLARP